MNVCRWKYVHFKTRLIWYLYVAPFVSLFKLTPSFLPNSLSSGQSLSKVWDITFVGLRSCSKPGSHWNKTCDISRIRKAIKTQNLDHWMNLLRTNAQSCCSLWMQHHNQKTTIRLQKINKPSVERSQ